MGEWVSGRVGEWVSGVLLREPRSVLYYVVGLRVYRPTVSRPLGLLCSSVCLCVLPCAHKPTILQLSQASDGTGDESNRSNRPRRARASHERDGAERKDPNGMQSSHTPWHDLSLRSEQDIVKLVTRFQTCAAQFRWTWVVQRWSDSYRRLMKSIRSIATDQEAPWHAVVRDSLAQPATDEPEQFARALLSCMAKARFCADCFPQCIAACVAFRRYAEATALVQELVAFCRGGWFRIQATFDTMCLLAELPVYESRETTDAIWAWLVSGPLLHRPADAVWQTMYDLKWKVGVATAFATRPTGDIFLRLHRRWTTSFQTSNTTSPIKGHDSVHDQPRDQPNTDECDASVASYRQDVVPRILLKIMSPDAAMSIRGDGPVAAQYRHHLNLLVAELDTAAESNAIPAELPLLLLTSDHLDPTHFSALLGRLHKPADETKLRKYAAERIVSMQQPTHATWSTRYTWWLDKLIRLLERQPPKQSPAIPAMYCTWSCTQWSDLFFSIYLRDAKRALQLLDRHAWLMKRARSHVEEAFCGSDESKALAAQRLPVFGVLISSTPSTRRLSPAADHKTNINGPVRIPVSRRAERLARQEETQRRLRLDARLSGDSSSSCCLAVSGSSTLLQALRPTSPTSPQTHRNKARSTTAATETNLILPTMDFGQSLALLTGLPDDVVACIVLPMLGPS